MTEAAIHDSAAAPTLAGRGRQASVTPLLFVGFAVASIGGPLALPTLLPGAAGDSVDSAALVVVLALAVFAVPLAIWLSYSQRVVSAGGLTAFVDAAAGRKVALVQGWIWAFAYFLYLPYTVTFVVYDLLTPVFPGITPYQGALELTLPVALVAVALAPLRVVLVGLGAVGAAQLLLLTALGGIAIFHVGGRFSTAPTVGVTGRAVGATALLFICSSLPLYLGAETRGGRTTVRRGLVVAVALVGAAFVVAAIPLAAVPDSLRSSAVPGAAIAQAYGGRGLGVVVGLFTTLGTLALIVAEYLALARLLHWLHGPPVRDLLAWIAIPFIAADAISLIDPEGFYTDLLKPSLAALFVSQFVVFAVFPRFRRSPLALVGAVMACSLAAWGLYTLFAAGAST